MQNPAVPIHSTARPKPLSTAAAWDRVDPLAPDCGADPTITGLADLPYYTLRGPGFERLVYELLQAENERPFYFGRNGQADYGVDIVTQAAGRETIYQCKNEIGAPSFVEVRAAVAKFESEWLGDMNLPAPTEFVYCCPHRLDDRSFGIEWAKFKNEFRKRTGVAVSFWDLNTLRSKLNRLPDIVAGLFSDSCAEHFCGRDDWRSDPWIRLQRGTARFVGINRFLDRHDRNAIYISESQEQFFLATLDQGPTIALRGLPGMGKTFLALELACRMCQPVRRIYYATFKDDASAERLWQSAIRRLSLPAVFALDDCHLAPQAVEILLERLGPELQGGKLKLVLILRDQVSEAVDQPDDTLPWLAHLEDERAVVDLRADATRTLAVACRMRPNFIGLSRSRLERLHDTCGGDLLLLDEILQTITGPQDIDRLEVGEVLSKVRTSYLGGNVRLPTVTRLASLAQFDLSPRADFFEGEWQQGELNSADPLMTRLFAPARYQFLHSSLAALMLRALTQLDVRDDALDDTVASISATAMRDYLLHLSAPPGDSNEFGLALQQALRGRLRLLDAESEVRMRSAVLSDRAVETVIEASLSKHSFTTLGLCVRWLSAPEKPAKANYVQLIEHRFRILFRRADAGGDIAGMSTMGTGLSVLQRYAPARWRAVLEEYGANGFLRLVLINGTLPELFKVLLFATAEFRNSLLEMFTAEHAGELLEKTIATGRSIGTLDFTVRELGKTDPGLLTSLENAIGAPGLMRLILSNGTLFELFRILQYATPEFRPALLDQLTATQAEELLKTTIRSGRSIGTFALAMRDIGEADPDLLARLEDAIGAPGFLRLILTNGTLFELFSVLQYATNDFRTALLAQLTSVEAAILVKKTIDAARSIRTLRLGMRELRKSDRNLLTRIEQTVGAQGFLSLVRANGTLIDLFRILEYATSEFRTGLLTQLTPSEVAMLLDKAVAGERRGIENLHFLVRSLASPNRPSRFETVLAVRGWWRLLIALGTLNSLSKIINSMSNEFRIQVVAAATELSVPDWRSIIERGLFLNACAFVTKDLSAYPLAARDAFRAALIETAPPLAARATWFDLNPSRPPVEPKTAEGTVLRAAFRNRIDALQPTELFNLPFREAVNALACCWRERLDLRSELGRNLRKILPSRDAWPREKGEVAALRLILTLARSSEFPETEARWLLAEVTVFLNREVCGNIDTLPLFLLVWNLAALSYERGLKHELAGTLPDATQDAVLAVLADRVHPKGTNLEKLWQFALGGLLVYLFPQHETRLITMLAPLAGAVRWLAELAMNQTFVPAVFALEGIGLQSNRRDVFTSPIREVLLRKFDEYEDVGPALKNLRLHVLE